MAFTQSLTFCQENNCQSLVITDTSNYGDTISLGDVTKVVISFLKYGETTTRSITLWDSSLPLLGVFKTQLSGHVSATMGTATLTGASTDFVTELAVGDIILIGDYTYTVKAIGGATTLTIMELFGENIVSQDLYQINLEFTLDSIDINGDSVATFIDDGIYDITYTVTAGGSDYVYEVSKEFICQAECCLLNKVADATETWLKDPCDTKNLNESIFGYSLLQGLKTGAYSGSQAEFETILAGIQQYCEFTTSGCSSCS